MTTSAPAAPAPAADTAAPSPAPAAAAPSPAPAAQPTPDAPPAADAAPASADTPPPAADPKAADAPKPTEYKIPDAFKDKPWASKIKSEDDLWKALDGAQTLIGKKHIPIDPKTATPQQLEEYKAAMRPQDIAEYKFSDKTTEEERTAISGILHKAGAPAWMANEIVAEYSKMEEAREAQLYSEELYLSEMKESFGEKYEEPVGKVKNILDKNLNEADKTLLEHVPNNLLALIYRAVHNVTEAYGIVDTGAGGGTPPGGGTPEDLDAQADGLLNQIQELDKRPHSIEERKALIDKRAAIFAKKAAQ